MVNSNTKKILAVLIAAIIVISTIVVWQYYPTDQTTENPEQTQTPTYTATPTTSPTTSPTSTTLPDFTLTVIGVDGATVVLNKEDVLALSATSGIGGFIRHNTVEGVGTYTGVSVPTLCNLVGGIQSGDTVTVTASDGYTMTYSYEQVNGEGFACYSATTGSETTATQPMTLIVAYYQDGAPLSSDQGTLRTAVVGSEGLVTQGNQWVKYVTTITVSSASTPPPTSSAAPTQSATPAPTTTPTPTTTTTPTPTTTTTPTPTTTTTPTPQPEWSLTFCGGNNATMTNLVFETQQATTYTDSSTTWSGVPLYQLVNSYINNGNVDAGILALGYNVSVIAGDGYTCVFESSRVNANNNIILANKANGTELTDKYYPLTLAGSDLAKRETVKNVVAIQINLALPSNITLTITGIGGTQVTLTGADIASLPSITAAGGYNSHGTIKGVGNYTGITVLSLCNMVGGLPNGNCFVRITGSDTYTKEFTYEQLVNGTSFGCYDPVTYNETTATQPLTLLVAYACDGQPLPSGQGPLKLTIVGPEGMLTISSLWVKDTAQIDIFQLA